MEYQISAQPNWHRCAEFKVPAELVKPQLDRKYEHYGKSVKLEGFRKGRVPAHLVKKMFGKTIESEIFHPYIREAYDRLFKENEFDTINTPEVRDLQFDESNGLTFAIHFDVRPVFEVAGYKGMEVEKEILTVSETDVDRTLKTLQTRHAMIFTVEGEARAGHFVVADMQEVDGSGIPVVGKRYENEVLWLQEERPEITSQLVGVRAGEERRVRFPLPADAEKGTQAEEKYFQVTVKEIKERRLPELDDEFARDLGAFTTMAELRQDILTRLQAQAGMETRSRFEHALIDELVKRVDLEAPASMVDNYVELLVSEFKKKSKEAVADDDLRAYYRVSAVRNVKWYLIREQLVQQLQLTISDEELEARLREVAAGDGEAVKRAEEIRNSKEQRERLRDEMEDEKVQAFLIAQAKITELHKPLYPEKEENAQSE